MSSPQLRRREPSLNNLFSPLPVTTNVIERSTVLTVAPVELKYTATTMGRFGPYAVVGLGTYTSLSTQGNDTRLTRGSGFAEFTLLNGVPCERPNVRNRTSVYWLVSLERRLHSAYPNVTVRQVLKGQRCSKAFEPLPRSSRDDPGREITSAS